MCKTAFSITCNVYCITRSEELNHITAAQALKVYVEFIFRVCVNMTEVKSSRQSSSALRIILSKCPGAKMRSLKLVYFIGK